MAIRMVFNRGSGTTMAVQAPPAKTIPEAVKRLTEATERLGRATAKLGGPEPPPAPDPAHPQGGEIFYDEDRRVIRVKDRGHSGRAPERIREYALPRPLPELTPRDLSMKSK